LADTALILLCKFGGLVLPSRCHKLLGRQTDLYWIPEISLALPLALSLSQTHKRVAPKEHLDKVE
jgi:hypothetical protein